MKWVASQATVEEIDDPDNEWKSFQDLSGWQIPKFRFLEVRKGN